MYRLTARAAFDSAHFLSGYNGKCANIHGHRWVIEAAFDGCELQQSGPQRGMLLDFGDLKKAVRALADRYDHALIYESGSLRDKTLEALHEEGFHLIELPFRPTAELLAQQFFTALLEQGYPIMQMTVYETPENCAVYAP